MMNFCSIHVDVDHLAATMYALPIISDRNTKAV